MNRLFVSLYFDEDVSVLIAKLVRSRGLTGQTAAEAGQLGRSDAEQLAFATERQIAIVTHNRLDFEQLADEYRVQARDHSGIIISVRRSPYDIARRLLVLLNQVTAEEMDDQVMYI